MVAAAGLTDAAENLVLDHFLRGVTHTPWSTIYVRLYSTAPQDDGTGGVELAGTGYAPQAVAFGSYTSRRLASSGAVTFTNSGGTPWPQAVAFGLASAASGGTLAAIGALEPFPTVGAGGSYTLAAGELVAELLGFTPWFTQRVLELLFKNTAHSALATVRGILYSVAPDADGAGGTELSASGYARPSATFAAASGGRCAPSANVVFTAAAPAAWGAIKAAGWIDAASGGNLLVSAPVAPEPNIGAGAPFSLAAASTWFGIR